MIAGQRYSLLLNTVRKVLIERYNNQYKDPKHHVASGVTLEYVGGACFQQGFVPSCIAAFIQCFHQCLKQEITELQATSGINMQGKLTDRTYRDRDSRYVVVYWSSTYWHCAACRYP